MHIWERPGWGSQWFSLGGMVPFLTSHLAPLFLLWAYRKMAPLHVRWLCSVASHKAVWWCLGAGDTVLHDCGSSRVVR